MFYGIYVGTQIQRLPKKLFNRFDDNKNIPANNILTFDFIFQFVYLFVDGKLYLIFVSHVIDNRFQTKTRSWKPTHDSSKKFQKHHNLNYFYIWELDRCDKFIGKKHKTIFVYLSTIIKIVSYTHTSFALFGGKSVMKSIMNFLHGFENIGNVFSSPYGVYRFIYPLANII